MRILWIAFIAMCVSISMLAAYVDAPAQGKGKGKGWGGKGKGKGPQHPALEIEDVRPDGIHEFLSLLPSSGSQPSIGLTSDTAYRLDSYDPDANSLRFVTLDFRNLKPTVKAVRLPSDAPRFQGTPRMANDGGSFAVVTRQAAVLFVDMASGRAQVVSGFDDSLPLDPPERHRRFRHLPPEAAYSIHGGAGGAFALSVLSRYEIEQRRYTGENATLYSPDDRPVQLAWSHAEFGVPPSSRDAVFAVTDEEIRILVTRQTAGLFGGGHQVACLVFDRRGEFKKANIAPGEFEGEAASTFMLSPCGLYAVLRPRNAAHPSVFRVEDWQQGYTANLSDACAGFAPSGGIGVFTESLSSERVALKAIRLSNTSVLWSTSISTEQAEGRPISAIGPGAVVVASRFGLIRGMTTEKADFLFTEDVVDFAPLATCYDEAGRSIAILARDGILVIDARTRDRTAHIKFNQRLPEDAVGEFIAMDGRSRKVLACVRGQGLWLVNLASGIFEQTLPPIPGQWIRPLPDLSGVVYTSETGNMMLAGFGSDQHQRIHTCETPSGNAVCLWISPRGNEFLVAERGGEEGKLFLVNDRGNKLITYNVSEVEARYVGDAAVVGFVTRRRQAVLVNELNRWGFTGINCTIISSGNSQPDENFSAVFSSGDLPGSSTYGETATAPFFAGAFWNDERVYRFACPAGILEIEIGTKKIRLYAWSRSPKGFAAIHPNGREFFVAGASALSVYRLR